MTMQRKRRVVLGLPIATRADSALSVPRTPLNATPAVEQRVALVLPMTLVHGGAPWGCEHALPREAMLKSHAAVRVGTEVEV